MENEYEHLISLKNSWLKNYRGYADALCKAVLLTGRDDDLGDPISKERHHLTAKSLINDQVKVTATQCNGKYIEGKKGYAETRRLIVTVGELQPVYMTFTDDPDKEEDTVFNVFVPGEWMNVADSILTLYDDFVNRQTTDELNKKLDALKRQLLVGNEDFGVQYENRKENV